MKVQIRIALVFALSFLCFCRSVFCQEIVSAEPLASITRPYAENDFMQKVPLKTALGLGIRFIEADTFLLNDRLMVGSSVLDMQSKGSLEALYFAPLYELFNDRSELIFDSPLMFLIDIKSDGELTYRVIRQFLQKYSTMLTKVLDGNVQPGPVTVVITGDCPREMIIRENPRYAAIDGRITDLDSNMPPHLMPMISARWGSHFRWVGRAEITKLELNRLQSMVSRAHAKNRLIRFWSTPDVERVWMTLRSQQVDLVGAEDFTSLAEFFVPRKSPFESKE